MKEEIEKVLSDESYSTNEERVDAIAKSLATLMIPKDIFNDVNKQLKKAETDYSTLNTEFDEFKKSKMTDDEKFQAEREKLENDKKATAIKTSELAVKNLLFDNGIKITDEDVELKETLNNIVSEDYDKSMKLANNFVSLLNKTKEITQKQTVTDLLNDTPKPTVSTPNSGTVSNYEAYKAKYDEAVKESDSVAQAQYMRLMQMEQAKQTLK